MPEDEVFLFGFSRGAFTVRALAGLTWRYGIPAGGAEAVGGAVRRGVAALARRVPDEDRPESPPCSGLRAQPGVRACPIHFLGLWDTVKSYGGLRPVMLPHLRHNPSVGIVRHALALDERRGWFEANDLGWLDSDRERDRKRDRDTAVSRLDDRDVEAIKKEDVVELWFSGCHADVGGGGGN